MINYDRRFRAFAMGIAALAGFVDAAGFVLTQGLFVSFMSGNSTRLAVGFVHEIGIVAVAAGLLLSLLGGVIAGALIASAWPRRRKTLLLFIASLMLVGAAVIAEAGSDVFAALLLAATMGSLNNLFLREGEVSIAVTYMTGTLVRAGQRIAASIRGEGPSDWLPYLLLWASLLAGAVAGAFASTVSASFALWIVVPFALSLTLIGYWLERGRAKG
jgi:uncharacterized membrane protein YoaK (UPF0700 family)